MEMIFVNWLNTCRERICFFNDIVRVSVLKDTDDTHNNFRGNFFLFSESLKIHSKMMMLVSQVDLILITKKKKVFWFVSKSPVNTESIIPQLFQ